MALGTPGENGEVGILTPGKNSLNFIKIQEQIEVIRKEIEEMTVRVDEKKLETLNIMYEYTEKEIEKLVKSINDNNKKEMYEKLRKKLDNLIEIRIILEEKNLKDFDIAKNILEKDIYPYLLKVNELKEAIK